MRILSLTQWQELFLRLGGLAKPASWKLRFILCGSRTVIAFCIAWVGTFSARPLNLPSGCIKDWTMQDLERDPLSSVLLSFIFEDKRSKRPSSFNKGAHVPGTSGVCKGIILSYNQFWAFVSIDWSWSCYYSTLKALSLILGKAF